MNTIETIKLDRVPKGKMPVLHASQYDNGRTHGIDLTNLGEEWKLDGTEKLTINERKVDNNICSMDIENTFVDSSHIEFASFLQMCACAGSNFCELRISKGGVDIGTLNFILEVEPDPTADGIESESEIRNLKTQVEAITEEVIGDDYYTAEQTDEAIATAIEGKADKATTYTKAQVDSALSGKANVGVSYTKSEEDNLLSGKADKSTTYTKQETDTLLSNKADMSDTYTKEQVDDIVYNILPDDTASGSVANFNTSLELPVKSLDVDVNAVQSAGTPTPATPLPISGWSEISLYQRGVNLFDKTTIINDYYINDNDGTQRYNVGDKCTDYIEIKPNASYFIYTEQTSGRWGAWYDENKNYISGINNYGVRTAPANAKYARFTVVRQGNGNVDTFSVNYPSTFTTYEPYKGNTEVINLGGTYYGGHFTQDKAGHRQFEVTHIYAILNGSEDWQPYAVQNGFYVITPALISNNTNDSICNLFEIVSSYSQYGLRISAGGDRYYFCHITDNIQGITDVNSWKAWVNNNNIQVVSKLTTPIIIDLPDGEPINTLNGTNNIYADTGDCAVEYKVSVEDYVSAHSGGNLLGMGGVYLGGAKSGGSEEETDEGEDTEKTKGIDELKEEIKTIGDMKKLGGE